MVKKSQNLVNDPLRYVLNIETVQAGLSSSYFFCHNNLALLPKKGIQKLLVILLKLRSEPYRESQREQAESTFRKEN